MQILKVMSSRIKQSTIFPNLHLCPRLDFILKKYLFLTAVEHFLLTNPLPIPLNQNIAKTCPKTTSASRFHIFIIELC